MTKNKYLAGTLTVLFWVCWPIYIILYYISITILTILKLLYWPIAFVLQPVVYLLRFITACLALPFRALVKLEVNGPKVNFFVCAMPYLTMYTPASVQLLGSCGTGRPARWTGTFLHLQHFPPPLEARLGGSAPKGTHCQTVPSREISPQGKIRATSPLAAESQQWDGRQSPQRPRQCFRQGWQPQSPRSDHHGGNGLRLLKDTTP